MRLLLVRLTTSGKPTTGYYALRGFCYTSACWNTFNQAARLYGLGRALVCGNTLSLVGALGAGEERVFSG
jgi:hypothetical protein